MADATKRYVGKSDALRIIAEAKKAYTNQNAIGKVKIGQTVYTADEAIDQIELIAGNNVEISIENDAITISAADTTYAPAVAATSGVGGTDGLLTGADKEKIDGIEAGAEVNQNAFSGVKVGASTLAATSKTGSFELEAGSNVSITPDANADKITISAEDTTYTLEQDAQDGHKVTFTPSNGQPTQITIPDSDTTYDDVVADSTGAADSGLMTSGDKDKLDKVAAGAQVNVIEGVKVGTETVAPVNKIVGLGSAAGADVAGAVANDGSLPTGAAVQSYVAGLGYQTAQEVATAIAGAQHITMSVVATLPATGETNVIYLVPDDQGGANKDMYIWQADAFVLVGNTEVDLSDYVQFSDLGGLTEAEVNEIIAAI